MPKVVIIILNWNGWQDTIECLESLKELDYDNFEIIVVDNASTDESVQKLRDYLKNYTHHSLLITNYLNLGFAGGNNIGIKHALKEGTDYVLLLNNDTVVDKNFLKELVRVGESDKKIGILGPAIYFFDEPDKIWFLGGRFSWLKTRWLKGRGHLGYDIEIPDSFRQKPQKVDFITGCACLVKQEVIKKIGCLAEEYFLYYEDVDWSLRARKAGYQCMVAPKSKIWHKISASARKIGSPRILRYHFRNVLLLVKKNAPPLLHLVNHFWAGWIFSKQLFKLAFFPSQKKTAIEIIRGLIDYYQGKFGQII